MVEITACSNSAVGIELAGQVQVASQLGDRRLARHPLHVHLSAVGGPGVRCVVEHDRGEAHVLAEALQLGERPGDGVATGQAGKDQPVGSVRRHIRVAAARCPTKVGHPRWSSTTATSARSAPRRSIVRTKL